MESNSMEVSSGELEDIDESIGYGNWQYEKYMVNL